jgi:predicted DNA-binding transcriptional regulator AlpA
MSQTTDDINDRLLPMPAMRRRYSVSDRTIDRWLARGVLPEPIRINRYRYWRLRDLEQFERNSLKSGGNTVTADAQDTAA